MLQVLPVRRIEEQLDEADRPSPSENSRQFATDPFRHLGATPTVCWKIN